MKNFLILIWLLFQVTLSVSAYSNYAVRNEGYYVDARGQVPEYSRIAPPHEEKIPTPHATKTVVPFERYYDINKAGYRPMGYQAPLVPGHNIHYSERRAKPYTRDEYLDVWCSGIIDYRSGSCTTKDYVLYFFRARDWSVAVAGAPIKNKIGKKGKPWGVFLMCDHLGIDAQYMHSAKRWAELYNVPLYMATIDAYIPLDWLY